MSESDSFINLTSGMFSTCAGYWDEKNQQYIPANDTHIAKCCIENCKDPLVFCQKYCKENQGSGKKYYNPTLFSRCLSSCNYQRDFCFQTCRLSSQAVGTNNNYLDCAFKYGCEGEEGIAEPECVRKHKDEIYNCCRTNCVPTRYVDCDKNCTFLQDITINPRKLGLPKLASQTLHELVTDFPAPREQCTWTYVFGAVILSFLIFTIWMIWRER